MNEFMWFIYFADVVPAAGKFCVLVAVVSALALIFVGIGGFIGLADTGAFESDDATAKKAVSLYTKFVSRGIIIFAAFSVSAIAIPDKQTIYAMAAVKAAEELSRTDIAVKAKDAIELTLDDIIKKYTPKKEKEGK